MYVYIYIHKYVYILYTHKYVYITYKYKYKESLTNKCYLAAISTGLFSVNKYELIVCQRILKCEL